MAIKTEELSLPGFGSVPSKLDPTQYAVRYLKCNLDDPGDKIELERIETRGLNGTEIIILNKDKFTFMDKYIIIVTYLEKRAE